MPGSHNSKVSPRPKLTMLTGILWSGYDRGTGLIQNLPNNSKSGANLAKNTTGPTDNHTKTWQSMMGVQTHKDTYRAFILTDVAPDACLVSLPKGAAQSLLILFRERCVLCPLWTLLSTMTSNGWKAGPDEALLLTEMTWWMQRALWKKVVWYLD